MLVNNALGSARGAAAVSDLEDIVGLYVDLDVAAVKACGARQQVNAKASRPQGQHMGHNAALRKRQPTCRVARRIDHQRLDLGILQHKGLVFFGAQGVQGRVAQPHQVGGNDGRHGLDPVARQHGNAVLLLQAQVGVKTQHAVAGLLQLPVAPARRPIHQRFTLRKSFERRAIKRGHGGALVQR